MSDENVQVTADGLIDLRLHSELARRLHLDCGQDHLFWTEAGRELARMAQQLDPVYGPYNLSRYKWFGERMTAAASAFPQILILGAGYDTRSLSLASAAPASSALPRIFEVDFPEKLATKQAVLAAHDVQVPATVRFVGADLTAPGLADRLTAAGYRPDEAAAVFLEGVFFFLPQAAAKAVLDPKTLPLAAGSSLTCDFWSASRQRSLNAHLVAHGARPLFGETCLGETPAEAIAACEALGYAECRVTGLEEICAGYGIETLGDPLGETWHVLEARCR